MKLKKKITITIILIFAVIILFIIGLCMKKYMFFMMPKNYIKNHLLEDFQIGSNSKVVLDKVEEHSEWKKISIYGLLPWGNKYDESGNAVHNSTNSIDENEYIVGTQHCNVILGESGALTTYAYFAFDDDNMLVDIAVYKDYSFY